MIWQSDGYFWTCQMVGDWYLRGLHHADHKIKRLQCHDPGFFSWFGWDPLIFVFTLLNPDTYWVILGNSILPTLFQQFGIGLFRCQHNNTHVQKARSKSIWFADMENLPGQSRGQTSVQSNIFWMNWSDGACQTYLVNYHVICLHYSRRHRNEFL